MKLGITLYTSFLIFLIIYGQDVNSSEEFTCDQLVSYSEDIVHIMDTYCAYSGCHFEQFAWGNFKYHSLSTLLTILYE